MPPSGIPLVPLTFPSIVSTSMTSIPSGSTSFQGFSFGSGHIPPSNLSLNLGQAQNVNPFQGAEGWPNPSISGLGAGNSSHLFCRHKSMPFPSAKTSQVFPLLVGAWNPYQGLSPSFNVPLCGNYPMYGNPIVGDGYPLNTFGP